MTQCKQWLLNHERVRSDQCAGGETEKHPAAKAPRNNKQTGRRSVSASRWILPGLSRVINSSCNGTSPPRLLEHGPWERIAESYPPHPRLGLTDHSTPRRRIFRNLLLQDLKVKSILHTLNFRHPPPLWLLNANLDPLAGVRWQSVVRWPSSWDENDSGRCRTRNFRS